MFLLFVTCLCDITLLVRMFNESSIGSSSVNVTDDNVNVGGTTVASLYDYVKLWFNYNCNEPLTNATYFFLHAGANYLANTACHEETPVSKSCEPFFQETSIPLVILVCLSPLVLFFLSWTIKRGKRPCLLSTFAIVDPCRQRFAYALFWGMVAFQTVYLIPNKEHLILSLCNLPLWLKIPVVLLNMLFYTFLYYPIIAGFASETPFGYGLAFVWTSVSTILSFWGAYDLAKEMSVLPFLVCSFLCNFALTLYLLVQTGFALRTVIKRKCDLFGCCRQPVHYNVLPESRYVCELLKRRHSSDGSPSGLFWTLVDRFIYHNVPYFRYSQTVISSTVVSCVFVFYMLYCYLKFFVETDFRNYIWIGYADDFTELASLHFNNLNAKEIVYAYFDSIINASLLAGIAVAFIQITLLATVLPCYRRDKLNLFRGCHNFVPQTDFASPRTHFSRAVNYMGYQPVMFLCGAMLQLFLFELIFVAIVCFVILPYIYGFGGNLLENLAIVIFPVLLLGCVGWFQKFLIGIFVTQRFGQVKTVQNQTVSSNSVIYKNISASVLGALYRMAKSMIVFSTSGHILAVQNRLLYSNYAYLAFFKNIPAGVLGALYRMAKSLAISVVLISRIDVPVFNRHIERYDNGFSDYVGLITVEHYHTNPCLVTFVNVALDIIKRHRLERKSSYVVSDDLCDEPTDQALLNKLSSAEERLSFSQRRHRAALRFKWYLAYTMIRNPKLFPDRKKPLGFMTPNNKNLEV